MKNGKKEELVGMLKEAIRKILLRILIWTEKKPITQKIRRKIPFWNREIHIPTQVIVSANIVLIFVVIMLEIEPTVTKLLGLFLLLVVLSVLFILLYKKYLPELAKDNDAVMLAGILIFGFVLFVASIKPVEVISPFAIPVAGVILLASILLNDLAGLLLAVLISFICAVLYQFKLEYLLYYLVSSIAAGYISSKIVHRQDITSAGGKIALINITSVVLLTLLGRVQLNIINIVWASINGIVSAILVLGLLSPFETFFNKISNIKLIELSDFNQPLLKRLMVEAPGTYHHSLTVATIAEQCSQLVGGNSLLVRVGAFYHDIGKLIKPEYFIENQLAMENPHDFILPSMSGLVIISHVK
ncbi:MAG: HDIG domain-containing protein, partial [Elusimicrobiota bacterium]|nr:HDIG domain-containing protein [Elusimicrobiota bacterium]